MKYTRWTIFSLILSSSVSGLAAEHVAPATAILQPSGVHGGLIVVLGLSDGMDLTAFRPDESFVVQGLDTDPARVAAAKKAIAEKGLSGVVTARVFDRHTLPYAEEMVNGIVIPDTGYPIPDKEIERVLVPGGKIFKTQHSSLISHHFTKPWPDDIDDWSHYNHDSANTGVSRDTRVGPPQRIKWIAPPLKTRRHFAISFAALVTAGGRIFAVEDEKSRQVDRNLPEHYRLVARDAFNGIRLWEYPLPDWYWAPAYGPGAYGHRPGGTRFSGTRPQTVVTDGTFVYLFTGAPPILTVLDAVTGEETRRFGEVRGLGEIVQDDGLLLTAVVPTEGAESSTLQWDRIELVAIEVGSWKQRWRVPAPGFQFETLTLHNGRAFYESEGNFVALDVATGREIWRTTEGLNVKTPLGWRMWNPIGYKDLLIVSRRGFGVEKRWPVVALDAATGNVRWTRDDLFQHGSFMWGMFPIGDKLYAETRVVHLSDGTDAGAVSTEGLWSEGHHFRCYPWRATPRHLISDYRGCEFLSLHPDVPGAKNDYLRGNCSLGVFPANGLLYVPPHGCYCYSGTMLNGFLALAAEADTAEPDIAPENPARLEKGTAWERVQSSVFSVQEDAGQWSMYRQNAKRLGTSETKVGADVQVAWDIEAGRSLTPPVCAGGLVVVADKDTHRVLAYDAATGQPRWTFTADARIDSPPTVIRVECRVSSEKKKNATSSVTPVTPKQVRGLSSRYPPAPSASRTSDTSSSPDTRHPTPDTRHPTPDTYLCLFGSSDGYVYCVDAADGALAWKFRAAPDKRWVMHNGQLESAWPVHGSVLVEDGVLYFTAGRHTWFDGGIHAYALDPSTGKVLHHRLLKDKALPDGFTYAEASPFSEAFHCEGSRSDLLVSDGEYLHLGAIRLNRQLKIVPAPYIQPEPTGVRHLPLTGAPYVDQRSFEKIPEAKAMQGRKIDKGPPGVAAKRTALHLSNTGGFLDSDVPFERYYWMYAERWPGNYHANHGAKSGQLLCVDDTTTYGVKMFNLRQAYGAGDPQVSPKGQLLFADANTNEPIIADSVQGYRAGIGYTRSEPPRWFHWKKMHINAIVADREHVFACGAPLDKKSDDPFASYEGRAGSVLMVFDKKTGEPVAERALDDQPVFDGLIAADGKLFMTTMNGKIICLKRNP